MIRKVERMIVQNAGRIIRAALVLLILGIGALVWALSGGGGSDPLPGPLPTVEPPHPTATPTVVSDSGIRHQGPPDPGSGATPASDSEATDGDGGDGDLDVCPKCQHVCHECHHSPHIIARGFYCQACAACETGCSSETLGGGDGFAVCTDIDDLGARLNELSCGQDAVTQKALRDLAIDAGCQQ